MKWPKAKEEQEAVYPKQAFSLVCMASCLPFVLWKNPEKPLKKWGLAVLHSLQIIQIQFVRLDDDFRAVMDLSVGFGCIKN